MKETWVPIVSIDDHRCNSSCTLYSELGNPWFPLGPWKISCCFLHTLWIQVPPKKILYPPKLYPNPCIPSSGSLDPYRQASSCHCSAPLLPTSHLKGKFHGIFREDSAISDEKNSTELMTYRTSLKLTWHSTWKWGPPGSLEIPVGNPSLLGARC